MILTFVKDDHPYYTPYTKYRGPRPWGAPGGPQRGLFGAPKRGGKRGKGEKEERKKKWEKKKKEDKREKTTKIKGKKV